MINRSNCGAGHKHGIWGGGADKSELLLLRWLSGRRWLRIDDIGDGIGLGGQMGSVCAIPVAVGDIINGVDLVVRPDVRVGAAHDAVEADLLGGLLSVNAVVGEVSGDRGILGGIYVPYCAKISSRCITFLTQQFLRVHCIWACHHTLESMSIFMLLSTVSTNKVLYVFVQSINQTSFYKRNIFPLF